jgi:hypothetical protein
MGHGSWLMGYHYVYPFTYNLSPITVGVASESLLPQESLGESEIIGLDSDWGKTPRPILLFIE